MDRTGAGDPARTVALLWRSMPAGRRGPRPGLSVDAVVDAAVALADAEGLAAVTVRRLGAELGVSAMTVYTYVPGKAELLDLMVDSVHAALPRLRLPARWQERVRQVAESNRAMYAAHPWLATVVTSRPVLGPGTLRKYECELATLDGLALSDVELDAALTLVLTFVQANAVAVLADSGNDADWWAAAGPALAGQVDPDAFPLASRVGTAAGAAQDSAFDPDAAWAFGIDRLVDGLARLVEDRSGLASRHAQ